SCRRLDFPPGQCVEAEPPLKLPSQRVDGNQLRFEFANREVVAAHFQVDGVTERSKSNNLGARSRQHAHFEQAPGWLVGSISCDGRSRARLQLAKGSHCAGLPNRHIAISRCSATRQEPKPSTHLSEFIMTHTRQPSRRPSSRNRAAWSSSTPSHSMQTSWPCR